MIYKLNEPLTIYNVSRFADSLIPMLVEESELVLDLSELPEIDSSGVQLLIHLKKFALSIKKNLKLINHPSMVIESFDLYNLHRFFGDDVVILADKD